METSILKYFKGDRVIWIILMLLSLISLLIVYSATGALAYREHSGNTIYYLIRQLFFIGAGIGLIVFMVNPTNSKILKTDGCLMRRNPGIL